MCASAGMLVLAAVNFCDGFDIWMMLQDDNTSLETTSDIPESAQQRKMKHLVCMHWVVSYANFFPIVMAHQETNTL